MKTYKNEQCGFEIDIPEEWKVPTATTPQFLFDKSVVFDCGTNEAFNIQIGPLLLESTLDFTERSFGEYAQNNLFTNLGFGRITVEDKKHVWARYYMGNSRWTKKYLIALGGVEYAITGTCFDFNLLEREKVWDRVVESFHLSISNKQDISRTDDYREKVAGELYAKAYQAVTDERYSEARDLLEQCLNENPNHILAHKELAVVLKKLGNLKSALAHRVEIKRLDPSDTVNRYNLADILAGLGEKKLAKREIQELQAMISDGVSELPADKTLSLTYADFYNLTSRQHPDKKRHLKLIYYDVPDIKYATNLLLVYEWDGDLSEKEADDLRLRAVAYLCCAIYDVALNVGVPCVPSPIPNGQRPAWFIEGEKAPVSLTLSDIGMSDRTLQLSIGPVVVSMNNLPINKAPLKKLMEGFRNKFNDIII